MANSLNKVQLIGNQTADADIKETPNWQKVATFSIATNRKWKSTDGQIQEDVEFHNIVAWRGLADIIENYSCKGKKLYVEWYLKTRSWDDASGVKRYKTEIVAESIILLSPNMAGSITSNDDEDLPDDDFQKAEKEKRAAAKKRATKNENISIEDIPF